MNAQALIGKVLGNYTLQQLIGQGGMGAVFLAQQSSPRRQVAVKVLLPVTPLAPGQHEAFLERFRRETAATASLIHPHIMPVYDHGEQDGLAYLVMPYVSNGTLGDELQRTGQVSLPQATTYLDQIGTALAVAHERGIIHRDIKPANILKTSAGLLLLADFGLVKIITGNQAARSRLTGVGMPLGTVDYMAPEQVMGTEVDARTDLYALGVILYQMVTGQVPFKGDMPMQIGMQHMYAPVPSPRILRPDLPVEAEQVIARTLAKQPVERYASVQDMVRAFHAALTSAGVQLQGVLPIGSPESPGSATDNPKGTSSFTRRGLFDPGWQTGQFARTTETPPPAHTGLPSPQASNTSGQKSTGSPSFSGLMRSVPAKRLLPTHTPPEMNIASPSPQEKKHAPLAPSPLKPISLLREKAQPDAGTSAPFHQLSYSSSSSQAQPAPKTTVQLDADTPTQGNVTRVLQDSAYGQSQAATGAFPPMAGATGALNPLTISQNTTGALMLQHEHDEQGATGTMKLMQSVKVVQIPVANQPGRYVTGFLPVQADPPEEAPIPFKTKVKTLGRTAKNTFKQDLRLSISLLMVVIVLFGSGVFLLIHASQQTHTAHGGITTSDPNAAAMQASATAQANIILTDSLKDNALNWPEATSGDQLFAFKDGAYHITVNNTTHAASALLPNEKYSTQLTYSVDMQEVNGDDGSTYNWFGLILRYSEHQKDGNTVRTFYTINVDMQTGEYRFQKYDDGGDPKNSPLSTIWHSHVGKEYHTGHDAKEKNTFKVSSNGGKFTFTVNGKQVGTAQDNTLKEGQIGMVVNLKDTEIAFSNLILTYH